MIEEPKTLRIARDLRRPTDAQIAAFQGQPTGFVLDAMMGAGAMSAAITPCPGLSAQACGPALVAGNRPGDLLATLASIHFAQAGDIVVAAAEGHQGCAAAGDRVMGMLKNAGAAGFVTDGPLRDLAGLQAVGLPAWCTGLTPGSPVARGPGTLGLPAYVGGQRVENGDMIVADADGVVVVPFAILDAVIAAVAKVAEAEHALDAEVADGLKSVGLIAEMLDSGEGIDWV
ncbi:Regulator of RNase E activity RraA [Jannaschia faecimaris]|uniref:Putative 4-hydroxy-4-methyl-2-oxoglutarate aldolase n=1 Tax=Jannaschia faecimaris TaxID=1244108 RepID=A0A1H3RNA6_9RHOB|nr:RraA family protein [Jannaschia faecimaris]SDZ26728.1 Regulator of RNase E activity RraA [Jannaschia faecimaris]